MPSASRQVLGAGPWAGGGGLELGSFLLLSGISWDPNLPGLGSSR